MAAGEGHDWYASHSVPRSRSTQGATGYAFSVARSTLDRRSSEEKLRQAIEVAARELAGCEVSVRRLVEAVPLRSKYERIALESIADRLQAAANALTVELRVKPDLHSVRLLERLGVRGLVLLASALGAVGAGAFEGVGSEIYQQLVVEREAATSAIGGLHRSIEHCEADARYEEFAAWQFIARIEARLDTSQSNEDPDERSVLESTRRADALRIADELGVDRLAPSDSEIDRILIRLSEAGALVERPSI
jgi:hypothetical protein